MQDGKPIAYASKSLTAAEVNFAQIEKEMYAIVFGCERFHQFVYGRTVNVQTDHLPLVSIFRKPLCAAPARLQRMMLRLQRYDLELQHLFSKEIPVADTLSRRFLKDTFPELSAGIDLQVNMVMSSLPVSDRKMQEIMSQTDLDPQLIVLKEVILQGWPGSRDKCQQEVQPFWNFRDELSVVDGIIMKGPKIVIPNSLRSKMLEVVHTGHMGTEKCLKRARDVMFWPGISAEITNMVLNCSTCLEHRNSHQKEPLMSHEIPEYPWQITATDLFTWENKHYLIVVDYYSRYFEVKQLPDLKSTTVISRIKAIYARWGVSEKLVSDNGPCYSSQEFANFASEWDFLHVTSSPHFHQSNGLAEKYVQICKRILTKAKADHKDPLIAFLEYRTTPLDIGYSPSQLLMSRQLRSLLPTSRENLLPQAVPPSVVKGKISVSKQREKGYYDRHAKPLKPLNVGDSTRIQQPNKTWKQAVVIGNPAERSYRVRTPDGMEYRRNRRVLLSTNAPMSPDHDTSDSDIPVPTSITENDPIMPELANDPIMPQIPTNPLPSHEKQDANVYRTRYGREVTPRMMDICTK